MKTNVVSDEIWSIIRETQKNIKELSLSQKETDEQIKRFSAELSLSQKETDEQIKRFSVELSLSQKETDEQIKRFSAELSLSRKETDQSIKEVGEKIKQTSEQMDRTDIRINKVVGDFGNRWGKLGENLVKGNLTQRLNERGIVVEKVITNAKYKDFEFDIIAINGKEVVVVEVKATLDPSDVDLFLDKMKRFKELWSEFKEKRVYGAMAFLIKVNKRADSLAEKKGFFVISATGDVLIQNSKDFKPKVFP